MCLIPTRLPTEKNIEGRILARLNLIIKTKITTAINCSFTLLRIDGRARRLERSGGVHSDLKFACFIVYQF